MCNPTPKNASAIESPDQASPVVLFHMMNFYKRKAEQLELQLKEERAAKKQQYEDLRNEIGDVQQQLHDRIVENAELGVINLRGAQTIVRKHQAGVRMLHVIDDFAAAIELVEETTIGQSMDMGLHYIVMKKNEIMQRAQVAMDIFLHGQPEVNELEEWENGFDTIGDNLVDRSIIDLTGEETEEDEDSGEETETDNEF